MEFQWHMTMWNTLERLQIKTIIVTITCMTNVICKFSVCIGYVWRFCRLLCLYNRKRRQCLKFQTAREQIKSRTSTLWFNLHMHLPMSNVFLLSSVYAVMYMYVYACFHVGEHTHVHTYLDVRGWSESSFIFYLIQWSRQCQLNPEFAFFPSVCSSTLLHCCCRIRTNFLRLPK